MGMKLITIMLVVFFVFVGLYGIIGGIINDEPLSLILGIFALGIITAGLIEGNSRF